MMCIELKEAKKALWSCKVGVNSGLYVLDGDSLSAGGNVDLVGRG